MKRQKTFCDGTSRRDMLRYGAAGLFGMGIINQPNVGILAVGSFQKRPVVKETQYGDTIVIRHMVYLTLSYDHRIIDGAYGTRFMARLVEQMESYSSQQIEG